MDIFTLAAPRRSSHCSTTGVIKAVVCAILSVGVMHIKYPLMLIEKSSPCNGGGGFHLSLYEWSFTICPTPYRPNRIKIRLVRRYNKAFPFFLPEPLSYLVCLSVYQSELLGGFDLFVYCLLHFFSFDLFFPFFPFFFLFFFFFFFFPFLNVLFVGVGCGVFVVYCLFLFICCCYFC